MKLTKMSLVAALLVGSSAFADDKVSTIMDSVKVSGDVNLFYSTSDAKDQTSNTIVGKTGSGDLFNKDSSAADASLNLAIAADLVKNDMVTVSGKAAYTVLSTLGLENNLVSNVWGGAHKATAPTGASYGYALGGAKVENANYFTEAYITVAAGNSAAQLGRMEVDTPLAFTEKWSAEKNTFEGIVALNKDIPDTTVVVAYLGNGNGNEAAGQSIDSNVYTLGLAAAGVVNEDGKFGTFGTNGAYALGVVNNSFKPLTVQAWYYEVSKMASAYWLQADLNMEGILLGGQYSGIDVDKRYTGLASNVDNDVFAVMAGYEMKDVVTVKLAYSQTGKDSSVVGIGAGSNVATSTGNTKLYTKTFWNYGNVVTANDTEAMKASVSSPVNGLFDACLSYTLAESKVAGGSDDVAEIAAVVKKSFGPLDAKLAYINFDYDDFSGYKDNYNMVQAYLSLNF